MTVSLSSMVLDVILVTPRCLWRHLLGLHSRPYGRSALDRSAQPWLLSAQYTVRLQSPVARPVHLLNKLEISSRDSAHCHVVGGYPKLGSISLSVRLRGDTPLYPRVTPTT